MMQVLVPDIGDFDQIEVIEVLVKPGDTVAKEQSLITLESDKATMEIPSPQAGVVKALAVKVGDRVSKGAPILTLEAEAGAAAVKTAAPDTTPMPAPTAPAPRSESGTQVTPKAAPKAATPKPAPAAAARSATPPAAQASDAAALLGLPTRREPRDETVSKPHASPSVRLFARELGVDLAQVAASGPKGRVLREDVQGFVKGALAGKGTAPATVAATGTPFNLPPWPEVDFAKFGPIEYQALPRIQKLSGPYLHRNWISIPHVTQFEEADITELEAFRKDSSVATEKQGFKLTMLAFLIKACVTALREHPQFNSSLERGGERIVIKKYFHIGVAVDTPEGLVVPVIRDADRKGVFDLARELGEVSKLARERKLKPGDMQGGTFSISSLGGIGGTAFTPIINAPEVAILGVARSRMRPHWDGKQFVPRLMLPLALSYDHRVIDGATAARFAAYLANVLADIRRTLL